MNNFKFKTIGVIGRVRNAGVKETLLELIKYLQHQLKLNVILDEETSESIQPCDLAVYPRTELSKKVDLVIIVGGDGSLLHSIHDIVNENKPVLGINRGSLGFLTDIRPKKLEKIESILRGQYRLEKRFLLTASIHFEDKVIGEDDALNEVALIPDATPHMIEFEIYVDNQFVCSQNSDGLIVATPTGSTAYALSGGGPILHPELNAVVMVPMFPHTLTSRPIVIDGDHQISIHISPHNTSSPRLSCDGRAYLNTPASSTVKIFKKKEPLLLIHPMEYDYYETLRSKLHWGTKLNYSE